MARLESVQWTLKLTGSTTTEGPDGGNDRKEVKLNRRKRKTVWNWGLGKSSSDFGAQCALAVASRSLLSGEDFVLHHTTGKLHSLHLAARWEVVRGRAIVRKIDYNLDSMSEQSFRKANDRKQKTTAGPQQSHVMRS